MHILKSPPFLLTTTTALAYGEFDTLITPVYNKALTSRAIKSSLVGVVFLNFSYICLS